MNESKIEPNVTTFHVGKVHYRVLNHVGGPGNLYEVAQVIVKGGARHSARSSNFEMTEVEILGYMRGNTSAAGTRRMQLRTRQQPSVVDHLKKFRERFGARVRSAQSATATTSA